jgi:hypothetical protein
MVETLENAQLFFFVLARAIASPPARTKKNGRERE